MSGPVDAGVTQRPELATFEEFDLEANARGYINMKVAPFIEVAVSAGTAFKKRVRDLAKPPVETLRAPGAEYNQIDGRFDSYSFETKDRGLVRKVDMNEAKKWRLGIDLEREAVRAVYASLLLDQEIRIANLFANAGFAGASGSDWTDFDNATPIQDVVTATHALADATGKKPNTLIISFKKAQQAWLSAEVRETLGLSDSADMNMRSVSASVLAKAFDIDQVLIHSGYVNSGPEDGAHSLGLIWPDETAYLAHCAVTANPEEMCVARQFHWDADGSAPMGLAESWYHEPTRCMNYRVRHQVGERIMYVEAAREITDLNG